MDGSQRLEAAGFSAFTKLSDIRPASVSSLAEITLKVIEREYMYDSLHL